MTNTTYQAAPWADVLYAMDRAWWRRYLDDVRRVFAGLLVSAHQQPGEVRQVTFGAHENSGAGAIALAAHAGARRVVLLGYDCQRTGGQAHWHGDHPEGLGNAGSIADWPAQFARVAARLTGVEVINCSRETGLRCWPRAALEDIL